MAGTRRGVPGRARGGFCGPLGDKAVDRLLGDSPTSVVSPPIITSLTIARDATKELRTINNLPKRVRAAAKQIANYWGGANDYAVRKASEEDLVKMMQSMSQTGSLILAVGATVAPEQGLPPYSPVRQDGMRAAEEALIAACGDDEDLFRSLELFAPSDLLLSRTSTDSWAYLSGRSTPEPLGCRLPDYDYATVREYATSKGLHITSMGGSAFEAYSTSVDLTEGGPTQSSRGYIVDELFGGPF